MTINRYQLAIDLLQNDLDTRTAPWEQAEVKNAIRALQVLGVLDEVSRTQAEALVLVVQERKRQDEKHGHHNRGLAHSDWLAIILEELGEVAKAALERNENDYRKELIEVAASAINAWEHSVNGD